MCDFCKKDDDRAFIHENKYKTLGGEITVCGDINPRKKTIVFSVDFNGNQIFEDHVKIKFCPMCGGEM